MIEINSADKEKIKEEYGEEISEIVKSIEKKTKKFYDDRISVIFYFNELSHAPEKNIQFMEFTDYDRSLPYHSNDDYYEFDYVMHGRLIKNIEGTNFLLEKGEAVFIAPKIHHISIHTENSLCISLLFKKNWFESLAYRFEELDSDNYLSEICKNYMYSFFFPNEDHEFHKIAAEIYKIRMTVHRRLALYDNLYFENLVRKGLITLTKCEKHEVNPIICTEKTGDTADKILRYILANYNKLSLNELSEHFGYSRTHIHRIIKSSTGVSFTKYVNRLKLKRAKLLLLDTKMPIADISAELGFDCPDSFTKMFKKCRLMTPNEYRRRFSYSFMSGTANSKKRAYQIS